MEPVDRILGFDMQTVFNVAIQLFNTAFLTVVLCYILYKPVTEFLNNRKLRIENSLKNAEESLLEAEKMKALYEQKLDDINDERMQIIEEARTRAAELEKQIISDARQEASEIKQRSLISIDLEKKNAVDDMKNQIITISSMLAEKYIISSIDEDMQNKLINEVIEELGDATWIN